MTEEDICYISVDGRIGSSNAVDKLCGIGSRAKKKFGFGEVVVLSAKLPAEPHPDVSFRKINPLNLTEYSLFVFSCLHLLTSKPYILVYQDDGYALNKDRWNPEFMQYDYIGAPWPDSMKVARRGYKVGNGGFSLRSRKLCAYCAELPYPRGIPEDLGIGFYYRDRLIKAGFKFAPVELAREFSCELPIDESHSIATSFGFHGKMHTKLAEEIENG